jgi:hypothetical protein
MLVDRCDICFNYALRLHRYVDPVENLLLCDICLDDLYDAFDLNKC